MKKICTRLMFSMMGVSPLMAQEKPNIIFFLVDDMGWQETSVAFHTERT